MKKKESIFWCVIIAVCCSCFETQGSDYSFDETGITRDNLENYLGRAVTMAEFLTVDPFCNDATYPDKERDIELIQNIGAKFIGRSIYRWGGEKAFNNPEFLGNAEAIAARVHENDPEVVFQAALFEAVSTDVNHIKVPSWVFEEFGLPIEERNFRYEDMLNLEGKYVGFWGEKTSVPDITRVEARLWFMFLAGTYINIGCEALHLGQIALIGMEDDGYEKWSETLDKIRGFAQKNARRNWVLLDAHTPWGGMVVDGKSLLDFNSFPLRIKEVVEDPFRSVLERGYIDAFYCRSEGGITPSGWYADALPYLVEFDNFGISDTPGQATIDSHYVWGYDEITWFYLQDEAYQKEWLHYAYGWLKENDTNGFLQMPVCRIVVLENEPVRKCHANTRTADFPHGMNLEETIKAIWNSSSEESARAPILNWQIGYHEHETEQPAEWFSARVPGAVQLDIMEGEGYEQPWWYGDNYLQFDWMETHYFTYKTAFEMPRLGEGERVFFCSKGIDYQFVIYLNDVVIWEQEGMFTHVNLDITEHLRSKNELKIVLFPVPTIGVVHEKGKETYRQNARESAKPAVSYGWDWHPRLVTRGIWDDTGLEIRNRSHLSDVAVHYTLDESLTTARLSVEIEGEQLDGKRVNWVLKDPSGSVVAEKVQTLSEDTHTIDHLLTEVKLWWPNGHGHPHLYTSETYLMDEDNRVIGQDKSKIGFRKVRLIMNEGGWAETPFPKTRAVAPASVEINNRRIFAKGANWVHPEVFVGLITAERYREQVALAKAAHFNMLRVWGGGITNKEAFFDVCDELGIMVWQEFPLACNNYTDHESYLEVLEQEARSIVKRVKKHPCLAIWSGGNELFNSWSGMTDQSLALRLLNSICYQLDPSTPFIYTSPIYGIGHGHYLFHDKQSKEDVFQWMARAKNTAYTEFAVPGVANLEVLKHFIPEEELFPPRRGTAWESHHAFGAWQQDSWLEMPTLKKYFGEIETLEELVAYSQLLQSEGLKFIYEEARRQQPYCSMALNWCYQEPWPTAANNSLINWPNEIKPAFYHVANACRPVLASARMPKFDWSAGEMFTCDLFMLNDSYKEVDGATVEVVMKYDDKQILLTRWECPTIGAFQNQQGPLVTMEIPEMEWDLFTILVRVVGKPQYDSAYVLLYAGNEEHAGDAVDAVKKHLPSRAYYNGETTFIFQ